MLLLQFALLNVLCLGHCTSDIITSTKELSVRNKLNLSKITFPILVQNKRGRNFIPPHANKYTKNILAEKLNNALWLREPKKIEDLGIVDRFLSKNDLVGSPRERRNTISSDSDLMNYEFANQFAEPKSLTPRNTTKSRLLNKRIQLKPRKRQLGYPKVVLPIQRLFADIGVSFQKYLSPDIFHDAQDGNANSLNIELLTADGKKLFASSWIKFDQSNLKLFGFPLQGNQNKHTFILKATNSKGKSAVQKISIVVYALKPSFNHYVYMCTTMTLSEYGGSVERRLRLAKAIANYIFPGLRVENVWIWKFQDSCMYLSFRHLPRKGKCDFNALQTIEEKVLDNGEINSAFQQALNGITDVVSVNFTVNYECRNSNATNIDDGLGWLRDIAPVFILLAVVTVPTLISCIVCREVRRRQAAMRQLQDRRMKEDREQMLLQAAEYKHECGLDSESEDGVVYTNKPVRQQEEEAKGFFGFSRIADIILPEVVMDTVKQGTGILNTLLPQEARDSTVSDVKVGANRFFPTVSNATDKLHSISQEEKGYAIKKTESSLTSKVKGVLDFIKSPLDITSFDYNFDPDEKGRIDEMKVAEKRKFSNIPTETLLPSISSIFGLNTNGGARGSFREVRKKVSTSIANRLQLMINAKPININKESNEYIEEKTVEKIKNLEASCMNDSWNQNLKVSQRLCTTHGTYTDFARPASVLVPHMRTKVGIPMQRTLLDSKIMQSRTEEGALDRDRYDGIKNARLLSRVLHQSRNLVNNARKWSGSNKDSQDNIQLKEVARGEWEYGRDYERGLNENLSTDLLGESIKEYKHSKRERDIATNLDLETPCDIEYSKNQIFDSIYADHSNPFNQHNSTPMNHSTENRSTDVLQEFTQPSNLLQVVVRNQELLENADRYFVNIGKEQVEKESSLIEAADASWRQLESRPGRQESYEKHTQETLQPNFNVTSSLGNKNNFGCSDKAKETTSRGLMHYDPGSGKWYPACDSLKKVTSAGKTSSLPESFKKNEEENLGERNSVKGESMYRSNLRWYKINEEPKRQVETKTSRRKNGIDIGSMFEHRSSSQYEQSSEPELNYPKNQIRCIDKREESIGIWTESIYENYMEDSDLYQISDGEADIQVLINKVQDESLQHRYIPNELYLNDNYYAESIQCERYREDQSRHLTSINVNPESDSVRHDYVDITNAYHMYLKYSEGEEYHTQQYQKPYVETQCCHRQGSTQEEKADVINQESSIEKSLSCGDSDTADDHSEEILHGRERSLTDGQLQLSMTRLTTVESPTISEPGATVNNKDNAKTQKERRRSLLERQRRVEIPEKPKPPGDQPNAPAIHVNPIFAIEERNNKDEMEERERVEDRFDFATIKRMQSLNESSPQSSVRMKKFTYSGPCPTANIEAEKFRKQDADIIEHQTKGYLERRRQGTQHLADKNQPGKASVDESEPIAIQNRARREDAQKRPGLRRFSTPSMESWTSTPEKYYYDATGDNSISEEDVNCAGLRKDKEKNPAASGRGRAKEYTQRLLQGVSPKIRRHSTSILGQRGNRSQSGNALTNTGTFLGRIGEGKLVQTIQTKLGKRDSKTEELKSSITKEKDRCIEEEKQLKESPLAAIRNTLFLLSGGK